MTTDTLIEQQASAPAATDPAVVNALQALYQKHKALKPIDVVEAAKKDTSPLHKHFQWDDGLAADEFRLMQARTLIRSVRIVIPEEANTMRRVWVHISPAEGYHPMERVVTVPDLFDRALRNLKREVSDAERAADELLHLAEQTKHRQAPRLARTRRKLAEVQEELSAASD